MRKCNIFLKEKEFHWIELNIHIRKYKQIDKTMVNVLYFGGIFPFGEGPAPPAESQSWSRTPSRPLHMLTGRSASTRSAVLPKDQNSKVRRWLAGKERLNEHYRLLTKETMWRSSHLKLCWACCGPRRQEDDSDWSLTILLIRHRLKGHVSNSS